MSFVRKTTTCWLWTGGVRSDNAEYGAFAVGYRTYGAHVAAWNLFRGKVPQGLQVLHRCDVKLCVRPDHLFVGTQKTNMVDMVLKDRHGNAKLTVKEVRRIRELREMGWRIVDIHSEYRKVTYRQIQEVLARTSWAFVV